MLITYMTFEDGRKIVASTWPRRNFEGLADIEEGRVQDFEKAMKEIRKELGI